MPKKFTIFLTTSPYSFENTLTAARLAENAINKGHIVNLIASGDGVYSMLKGQKAKGIPHAGDLFTGLMSKGMKIHL